MKIIFNTYEEYNEAKSANMDTVSIGDPISETDVDGLLTGRFIIDHQFTPEQKEELANNGIGPILDLQEVSPKYDVKA